MHIESDPKEPLVAFLRLAGPALVMPLIFTVIPSVITGNEALLRLAWSVIAPSSLLGALIVGYVPPLANALNDMAQHVSKIAVGLVAGGLVALGTGALGYLGAVLGIIGPQLGIDIATSAGIGAFATTFVTVRGSN